MKLQLRAKYNYNETLSYVKRILARTAIGNKSNKKQACLFPWRKVSFRCAAYLIAIERIAEVYRYRGIFP